MVQICTGGPKITLGWRESHGKESSFSDISKSGSKVCLLLQVKLTHEWMRACPSQFAQKPVYERANVFPHFPPFSECTVSVSILFGWIFLSSSSLLSSRQTPQIAYTFAMVCELCWDSSPFDSHKDGWLKEVFNNRFGLGFSSFCNRFGALILWQVERSIGYWLTVATSGLMTPRL